MSADKSEADEIWGHLTEEERQQVIKKTTRDCKMKPLSLIEIQNIDEYLDMLYRDDNGPPDYEGGPSEWDQRLIHTAKLYHDEIEKNKK